MKAGNSNHSSDAEKTPKQKVQVWIYFRHPETRVFYFLLLRTRPGRGDFWQPVTGSVESNEPLEKAALREAQEETGLEFSTHPETIEEPFSFESRGQQVIEHSFALEVKFSQTGNGKGSFPGIVLDPHEHVDFKWVTAKDALEKVGYPSNAEVLESFVRQLVRK